MLAGFGQGCSFAFTRQNVSKCRANIEGRGARTRSMFPHAWSALYLQIFRVFTLSCNISVARLAMKIKAVCRICRGALGTF